MELERIQGDFRYSKKIVPASVKQDDKNPADNAINDMLSPIEDLISHHELEKLKSKWRDYKQFYNTDTPPEQIGLKSKKSRHNFSKQLVSKTSNSIGSTEKGCLIHGRFLSFSSWDHKIHTILSKLGLHIAANLLDLTTDEIKGGTNYETRIYNEKGLIIASRNGVADSEGMYKLHVDFSDEEKKKASNAKKLHFLIYFRGINDKKDKYAHFNSQKDSEIPVGGGFIKLVSKEEPVISSDIDKTIMDTSIGPAYFFSEPWKRKLLPGAGPFFSAIDENLHTLSGSEQNLSASINAALELRNILPAESDYKDWFSGQSGGSLPDQASKIFKQVGYKIINELETDIHLPETTSIKAHGDITEYDPIIYLLLSGILSGDLTSKELENMFFDVSNWPELAKIPERDKETIKELTDKTGTKKGIDLIDINCGSGDPNKPELANIHKYTIKDFIDFAERLEKVKPGNNHYNEKIIFTDNYLQTAIYYRETGNDSITDKTLLDIGKELLKKNFSKNDIGESLKKALIKDGIKTPLRFLSPEKLKALIPLLCDGGIIPKDFTI